MPNLRGPATLRGFHVSVADIGDQMHLCHPVLSFENDDALYIAHHLDWQNAPDALAVTDPDEAASLGTLLPTTCSLPVASGLGVVAAGAAFVQAAECAGVRLDADTAFARTGQDTHVWIRLATPAVYAGLRNRLAEDARDVFDKALGDAVSSERCLSDSGNSALLLLRRCGPRKRDDLAIRQLAGARQNREFDLYRRLLIRFALELRTQESVLDERARRHAALVARASGKHLNIENEASDRKIRRTQARETGMSKPRDTFTYDLKQGQQVVYRGTTNDPERREREHRAEGKRFSRLVVTSRRMTDEGAKRKEAKSLATYRKGHGGRSPRYNRDADG